MGSASIKIYDKQGRVLRIETTTNDVSFFKHNRKVEHKTVPKHENWHLSKNSSKA